MITCTHILLHFNAFLFAVLATMGYSVLFLVSSLFICSIYSKKLLPRFKFFYCNKFSLLILSIIVIISNIPGAIVFFSIFSSLFIRFLRISYTLSRDLPLPTSKHKNHSRKGKCLCMCIIVHYVCVCP